MKVSSRENRFRTVFCFVCRYAPAWKNLGYMYEADKRFKEALEAYEAAAAAAPGDSVRAPGGGLCYLCCDWRGGSRGRGAAGGAQTAQERIANLRTRMGRLNM